MDMKRHDFESSIKCSDSYAKLIYMHGEKLFIFDDGKYKIAAMQLAWEIYCDRCDEIEGLKAQQAKVDALTQKLSAALGNLDVANKNLRDRLSAFQIARQEADDLQKRVDAAISNIEHFFDEQTQQPTQREYANFLADVLHDLKLEQALKGGEA